MVTHLHESQRQPWTGLDWSDRDSLDQGLTGATAAACAPSARKSQCERKPRSVGGLCLHWPHHCCYGELPLASSRRSGLSGVLPFQAGTLCLIARGLSPGDMHRVAAAEACSPEQAPQWPFALCSCLRCEGMWSVLETWPGAAACPRSPATDALQSKPCRSSLSSQLS